MNNDLVKLRITESNLKESIGFSPFRITILGTVSRILVVWLIVIICVGVFPESDTFTKASSFAFLFTPIFIVLRLFFKTKNQYSATLSNLVKDTQKFNSTIKAIDVNDQLVTVGNQGMQPYQRAQIIIALNFAREDLIKALKTERIMRENITLIAGSPELFANNLGSLRALQINEQAGEFGKILGDALQVSIDVQEEMVKLQSLKRA